MKKMLICCNYIAPYEGNFISSIKKLDDSINKSFEVTYLFPNGYNQDFIKWFNSFKDEHTVLTYELDDIRYIEKVSSNYDVIYLHFYSIELARTLSYKYKDKIIILHGHHNPIVKKWRVVVELIKSFRKRYNNLYVIACSRGVQKKYRILAKYFNVFLSNNCVDFDRIEVLEKEATIDKASNDYVISMFGSEYYTKGVDLACRAIKYLNNESIVLKVYCSHNLMNNENIIRKTFPDCNVVFLKYNINPCEIYLNSDIFISPSRFEGFNYSILECIYCGTTVIASNIKEQRHKGCPYYFFKNGNYKSLAKEINKVLSSNTLFIDKENIYKIHNISNWVTKTSKIIKQINYSSDGLETI